MFRRHPRRRQPAWQKWMNVALIPVRGQIEKVFGLMERRYLWRRVRYLGVVRNGGQLFLLCSAIHLRRADHLPA